MSSKHLYLAKLITLFIIHLISFSNFRYLFFILFLNIENNKKVLYIIYLRNVTQFLKFNFTKETPHNVIRQSYNISSFSHVETRKLK